MHEINTNFDYLLKVAVDFCRLFQISFGFYELVAGSTENCGRVLPRTAVQGLCN